MKYLQVLLFLRLGVQSLPFSSKPENKTVLVEIETTTKATTTLHGSPKVFLNSTPHNSPPVQSSGDLIKKSDVDLPAHEELLEEKFIEAEALPSNVSHGYTHSAQTLSADVPTVYIEDVKKSSSRGMMQNIFVIGGSSALAVSCVALVLYLVFKDNFKALVYIIRKRILMGKREEGAIYFDAPRRGL